MAIYGNTGSATFSSTFTVSPLDQMMGVLPDNTQNLISARNARDSIFTVWDNLQQLAATVSNLSVGGTQALYTNLNPTTIAVGGISAGSTFSNQTMQQMFDALLYPYTAPGASLGVSAPTREYGSSNASVLSYTAIKGKNSITSISISQPAGGPIVIVPTGNNQSGSQGANATQNATSSFTLSVGDGVATATSTATVRWASRTYWGTLPIGHPLIAVNSNPFSAADFSIAGVVSSSSLVNPETYVQSRLISANNTYVFFAWPTRIAANFDINTDMKVGGFSNNAFTKTRNSINFTNALGYVEAYDVWVYNTVLFSSFTYDISA